MNDDFWTRIIFLGERIGLTKWNLYKMKGRGIPAKHHSKLMKEAKATNTPLTDEELEQCMPEYSNIQA